MRTHEDVFNIITTILNLLSMKKRLLLRTMLLLCALVVGSGTMWGAEASFAPSNFSGQGTSGSGSAISAEVDGVTFACNKGYGTTQIRCYSGGKITISSSNTITAISFTFSGSYTGGLNTSYTDLSTTSWEQTLSSQARITAVTVTYAAAGDTRSATTVTIDGTGITNTNIYNGTAAGSLAATVKADEVGVDGATVTWSGNNDDVATINATTGVVTLVAAGSVTFTANYDGNEDYKPSSKTYNLIVTNDNPNHVTIWSESFSGYEANDVPSGGTYNYVCVDGVSNTKIYAEVLAGGTSPELLVGKSTGSFTATVPLDKYDGNLKLTYRTNAKQMTVSTTTDGISGSLSSSAGGVHELIFTGVTASTESITIVFTPGSDNVRLDNIELKGQMAAPVFSVASGDVLAGTNVTITATTGASIYYTTDGTTPTSSSTPYSEGITINTSTTINAIAIKDGKNSIVATASYTVSVDPFLSLSTTTVDATTAETEGTIEVTYGNLTNYDADVYFYESDGTTSATYDWITAEINESTKHVDYVIGENTTYEARTAYLKVYALGDEGEVYSDLVTVTQAGKVIDYATLPFSWDDTTTPTGVINYGVGSYESSPYLKFDTTGDYVILKINEAPGKLTFDIKGNGFSGGTFTLQESADGESYTDVAAYTELDKTQSETFTTLATTTRYIKWIYTEKSYGNVALGNITVVGCVSKTMSDAGWATYCSTSALDFSSSIENLTNAYIVTGASGATLTLEQITGKVAANTGILLEGTEGTINIPTAASGTDYSSTNKLKGVTTATAKDAETIYVLMNETAGVGFYKNTNAFTVGANTAYLEVGFGGSLAREFYNFGETTGINKVETVKKNVEGCYNLNGQRVAQPTKGLYIVNGRKVVIK